MQKRVTFRGLMLPLLLLAPQLLITLVFFIWPASQALFQSLLQQDPFGLRTSFVGLANFVRVLRDPGYLHSLEVTLIFSTAVTVSGLTVALLLATMADRVIKGGECLQDHPDLALRGGTGDRGRALAVHVQPLDRDRRLSAQGRRHRLEPPAERRARR